MRLLPTQWRDFSESSRVTFVHVCVSRAVRTGLGVDQLQDVHLFPLEEGRAIGTMRGSAGCPLGCEQELWLMVKALEMFWANSGDATKDPWKGCDGLGAVSWLLVVVVRVITICFNPFCPFILVNMKIRSWRHLCVEKSKIAFNERVNFVEKLFEKVKLKVAFSFV